MCTASPSNTWHDFGGRLWQLKNGEKNGATQHQNRTSNNKANSKAKPQPRRRKTWAELAASSSDSDSEGDTEGSYDTDGASTTKTAKQNNIRTSKTSSEFDSVLV